MALTGALARTGFFVAVVVIATAVGATTIGQSGQSAPQANQLNAKSFNADEAVATAPEEKGKLSMSADASGKVVVVDMAHAGSVDREALAPLVSTLTENGATVKYHVGKQRNGRPLNASLQAADAYVAIGAQRRYTESELNGLAAFSGAGGRVLLLNEPKEASPAGMGLFGMMPEQDGVTIPMAPLASQYGFSYDNGYLYNMHESDLNYRSVYATPTSDSSLAKGVDRTVFYAAAPVKGGTTVVTTTEQTALSQTRRQNAYSVVSRSGNVVAVGDTNIFTQEFLHRADNEQLVGNLLDFLVSGEKSPADVPKVTGSPGGGIGGTFPGGGDSPVPEPEPTPAPAPDSTPEPEPTATPEPESTETPSG